MNIVHIVKEIRGGISPDFQIHDFQRMISRYPNFDYRLGIPMESPVERKWTTLRNIASPQAKSHGEVVLPAVTETVPEEIEEVAGTPDLPIVADSVAPVEPLPDSGPVEVLIAHPMASTARLLRETLENFTECRVVTTSDPLRAFELSLQRRYGLFLFAMQTGELTGPMLYELISKAHTAGRGSKLLAPAVIFVREKDDPKLPEALARDARVKDVLNKPIRIERLLQAVKGVLEVRDPTAGG